MKTKDNIRNFEEGKSKLIRKRLAIELGLNPNANLEQINEVIDALDAAKTEKLDLALYSEHFGLDREATAEKLLETIGKREAFLQAMKTRLQTILNKKGSDKVPA